MQLRHLHPHWLLLLDLPGRTVASLTSYRKQEQESEPLFVYPSWSSNPVDLGAPNAVHRQSLPRAEHTILTCPSPFSGIDNH